MDDPTLYRQIVEALQYATIAWFDISFAVNKASQFMQQPTDEHWSLIKRILRCLKTTINYPYFLMLIGRAALMTENLEGVIYSSWVPICYFGNLESIRQSQGLASNEIEYHAFANVVPELTWLQSFFGKGLESIYRPHQFFSLTMSWGALYLSANSIFHACTKYVEVVFILFVTKLLIEIFKFGLYPQRISWQIFEQKDFLNRFQLLLSKLTVTF